MSNPHDIDFSTWSVGCCITCGRSSNLIKGLCWDCRPERQIETEDGNAEKVRIIAPDGTHILTLFVIVSKDGDWANIDIRPIGNRHCTVLAWQEGSPILRHQLPESVGATIDIKCRKE
jgi:hypothetical protein